MNVSSDSPKKIQKEGSGPLGFPTLHHVPYKNGAAVEYHNYIEQLRKDIAADIVFRKEELEKKNLQFYHKFFPSANKHFRTKKIENNVRICLESYDNSIEARRQRLKELLMRDKQENIVAFALHEQAVKDDRVQGYRDRLKHLQEKRRAEEEIRLKELNRKKLGHMLPEMVQHRLMEVAKVQKYQMLENHNKKMKEKEYDNMWHDLKLKYADAQAERDEYDVMKRSHLMSECQAATERQIELRNKCREEHEREQEAERKYIEQLCDQLKKLDEEENKLKQEKKLASQKEMDTNNLEQLKAKKNLLKQQKTVDDTFDLLVAQQFRMGDEKAKMRKRKELETVEHNKHLVSLKAERAVQTAKDDEVIACVEKTQREEVERKRCEFRKWQRKLHNEARQGILEQIQENETKKKEMVSRKEQIVLMDDVEGKKAAKAKVQNKLYQKELLKQIAMNQLMRDKKDAEEKNELAKILKEQMKPELKELQPWTHTHAFTRVMQKPIHHSCQ